jgi:tetratricopeptide (TPR) repeat protein
VYATLVESGRRKARTQQNATSMAENLAKAIEHLENAIDRQLDSDPNVRATLSRLYLASGQNEKAIPLLQELVAQEPGWSDGPSLLAQAYAGAGRDAEAITWLEKSAADDPELYTTLASFYERQKRWRDAANAYQKAIAASPKSVDLKLQYATALMNIGSKDALGARDALNEIVAARPNDVRSLFQLSQVQRRLGDLAAAENAARKVIAQNGRSPMGYYALRWRSRSDGSIRPSSTRCAGDADFRAHPTNNPPSDPGCWAASGVRVSGARRLRQGDRHLDEAQALADRRDGHGVSGAGEPDGERQRGHRADEEKARAQDPGEIASRARGAGAEEQRQGR